jgi:Uma2 family endonuclease
MRALSSLAMWARRWHRRLEMGTKAKLTYADFAALPEESTDGKRRELLAGVLYVSPAPGSRHQIVLKRLFLQMQRFFEGNRLGEVLFAPLDVILSDHDVAEPDIVVVETPRQISPRGIEGPPLLVVEIISPSTDRYDRVTKAARYLALGIRHYWILDPESRHLRCSRAIGSRWRVAAEGRRDDLVCDPAWPAFAVDLEDLWPEPFRDGP